MLRIGNGYDVHRLVEGRKLMLGGVEVPHTKGVLGHSDGDVLLHAIIDAIIGALGLGDIGLHFPDNDKNLKDIESIQNTDTGTKLTLGENELGLNDKKIKN